MSAVSIFEIVDISRDVSCSPSFAASDSSRQILRLPARSPQPSSVGPLSSLPIEILLAILSHLALFDRCALAFTCKFFAETVIGNRLLRYRTPNHDDILYYQRTYDYRSWGGRLAVGDPKATRVRSEPFPELAVPPKWFRARFCQGCRHCQSRFVPKWPYIDCALDPKGSSTVATPSTRDHTVQKEAARGGCRLHPHMPQSTSKSISPSPSTI